MSREFHVVRVSTMVSLHQLISVFVFQADVGIENKVYWTFLFSGG